MPFPRSASRAPGPQLRCSLRAGTRPCPASPPAHLHSSRCRSFGPRGPRSRHTERRGLAWAAPPRTTGLSQALRALPPDHGTEALSSVSFSRQGKTRLLGCRWEAQGLAAMARSCEQPAKSTGRSLSRHSSLFSRRAVSNGWRGRGVPLQRGTCQIKATAACVQPERPCCAVFLCGRGHRRVCGQRGLALPASRDRPRDHRSGQAKSN